MSKYTYKTNINCGGCVATVTPYLERLKGVEKWEVDTNSQDKILRVEGNNLSSEQVEAAVEDAGFKIERKKKFGLF
ncbi:heavy-metal-associated domain-containing protein [Roseivirga sp. BDSF3-8]|uniref:heavy-metal-associated domain-containing protein n=1 Tax=Roseivirga sp. BDSF3-8 TaxID=3241598 RepID=UPI0035326338